MTNKTKTHDLKIISYNLKYNRASSELASLVREYDADVLCVQECRADLMPEKIAHMTLADKTDTGHLNLAIYYRTSRFTPISNQSHLLKRSVVEQLLMLHQERLLVSQFYDNVSAQPISIGSFHAMYLMATNYLRRVQVESAHDILRSLAGNTPAIMVGDYNHPLFLRRLQVCIENTGYEMSLCDQPTYYMNKLLRGHFDLATSVNTQIERVRALPKGISDHTPILVHAVI